MKLIPYEVLDAGYRKQVHVEGWNKGCVFHYEGTAPDGTHNLVTPRTRRKLKTKNRLTYTKANNP